MRVYNTLSKRKEEFVPLTPGKVKMYVCGPTVYNLIHIGNARPMIVFDTVRRYLEHKGYEVNYVSNFTDVDDKIIAKANEEGVSSKEISERYIAECKKDMEAMNVRPATTHPLATQEIGGMVEMIQILMDKGYAYNVDGTVYFRTRKFREYGKLSHKNLDDLRSGNRSLLVTGEDQKEDPLDFVLWKPKKEGEPSWPSPWSDGRPGWHIECSVMSKKYLGEEIDIHAGGEDLIFPHHENEIAQSECCNGKPFARYWLHNAFLNIDNRKMSKSLGNFFTVREISEKYDLQVLRFFMLSAHYRSPLNFSADLMEAAASGLERIRNTVSNLAYIKENNRAEASAAANLTGNGDGTGKKSSEKQNDSSVAAGMDGSGIDSGRLEESEQEILAGAKAFEAKFDEAMDDDFNTADAIAAIFELVKYANSHLTSENSPELIGTVRDEIVGLCDILGLIVEEKEELLDADIEALIAERQAARKARDFARADEIRNQLAGQGITLLDTREGVKWKRA
ncbi:MAG: cysteine--tRNA ligase [Lachnospiraceae bacterium]|nr:cysteine--tRNA ligase [Lachnospiraceae bacterium]